jgi:hypothetical protein
MQLAEFTIRVGSGGVEVAQREVSEPISGMLTGVPKAAGFSLQNEDAV